MTLARTLVPKSICRHYASEVPIRIRNDMTLGHKYYTNEQGNYIWQFVNVNNNNYYYCIQFVE